MTDEKLVTDFLNREYKVFVDIYSVAIKDKTRDIKYTQESFTEDIEAINNWSRKFYSIVGGSIGYTKGDLFHMWHGDLKDRKYLKRI